jgi:parvulin-like peptidyl-prolyl isomerase
MVFAALLLAVQSSFLVGPLHHGESPPPSPALAAVRIADEPGRPGSGLAAARELLGGLRGPEEFTELVRERAAVRGGDRPVLFGVHPPGLLAKRFEEALEPLTPGQIAPPIELEGGVWIVQRLEPQAACRQIFVAGVDADARARAERLAVTARGGADFAALAREHSDDKPSALRGGAFAIFERGARDAALRAAVFRARMGEIVGPLATPLGFHIVQRVAVDELDPRLRDDNWARVRALLVAYETAVGATPDLKRRPAEAERIADELAARIRRGEDMAALAAEHTDDTGLRSVGGDAGWVRRGVTRMPESFDRVFVEPPGVLLGPIPTSAGFLLLRREDRGPRSRIDLRVEPFADLEQWVRKLAAANAPAPELEGLAAAVEAARALETALGSPLYWGWIEGLLPHCATARDFSLACAKLEESRELVGGRSVALRELATRFAGALEVVEPHFLAQLWPEHRRQIETRLAALRPEFGALGPSALEQLMAALGIEDPRIVAPVYLVAEGPWPGGVTHRVRGGAASWIAVESFEGTGLHEVIVHEVAHALDTGSEGSPSALNELRRALSGAGFGPRDRVSRDAPHALLFVASAHAVRRTFDPAHSDLGDVAGQYAKFGRAAEAVRAPWSEHFAGKLTRAEAVEETLEALKLGDGAAK